MALELEVVLDLDEDDLEEVDRVFVLERLDNLEREDALDLVL